MIVTYNNKKKEIIMHLITWSGPRLWTDTGVDNGAGLGQECSWPCSAAFAAVSSLTFAAFSSQDCFSLEGKFLHFMKIREKDKNSVQWLKKERKNIFNLKN